MINFVHWIKLKLLRKKRDNFLSYIGKHLDMRKIRQGEQYAIGQFLDDSASHTQIGIYGTSAAVQVLNNCCRTRDSIQKYLDFLISSKNDPSSRFNEKKQFCNTYKFCFFLDALEPWSRTITESDYHRYFDELMHRCINEQGWGEYHCGPDRIDNDPKILSTCLVLNSLMRYPRFTDSELCDQVLEWVVSQIDLPEHENIAKIFMFIVLSDYNAIKNNSIETQLRRIEKDIIRINEELIASSIDDDYPYHYPFNIGPYDENQYLYFPINAIIGLSLLRVKYYLRNSKALCKVLEATLDNVFKAKGGYKKKTGRQSTVDQLWLVKFVEELHKKDLGLKSYIKQNLRYDHIISILIMAAAYIYFMPGNAILKMVSDFQQSFPSLALLFISLAAFVETVAIIIIGLLARDIWDWLRNK